MTLATATLERRMTPSPRADVATALTKLERFVLSSHARPDGDSIGSQLALAYALRALGKTVRIVNHDTPPPYLSTLPGISAIEVADAVSHDYDAAVILECSSLARTEVRGLDRASIINIDHHAGNAMYGTHNWFDDTAAACAEQVHDLIGDLGVSLTPDIATALYVGILTDTGSFRHANITARTFDMCGRIAAADVNVANVAAAVYQNSSLGKIKLTGSLLDRMQLDSDGRIAILRVDDALMQRTGCPPDDMEGLINIPLSARSVQAVVLVRTQRELTRVSLRSKGVIDVRAVAASFGGGGHRNASGFSSELPTSELEPQLFAKVRAAIDPPASAGDDPVF